MSDYQERSYYEQRVQALRKKIEAQFEAAGKGHRPDETWNQSVQTQNAMDERLRVEIIWLERELNGQ